MEKALFEEMTLTETQQVDGGLWGLVLINTAKYVIPAIGIGIGIIKAKNM